MTGGNWVVGIEGDIASGAIGGIGVNIGLVMLEGIGDFRGRHIGI
jgi:hypothetical protein